MQNSSARKAAGKREMHKVFENVACPFCGMLCDDLEVENNDGTLKVANHGVGWKRDPRGPRDISPEAEPRFRQFLHESLPSLSHSPKINERLCFYCDTFDGDFWIDKDPQRPGLLVSAGGSGHAFKFTPLLGRITVDVLEGMPNDYAQRFKWRSRGDLRAEEARAVEEGVRK